MKGFSQQSKLADKYIPLTIPFSERDYKGYINELRKIKKNIREQGNRIVRIENEGMLDK